MSLNKKIPEKYFQPDLMPASGYWRDVLSRISRPSARRMLDLLDLDAPLGIRAGAHGVTFGTGGDDESVIDTLLRVKSDYHHEKIVAIRVGDFYEFFFLDAIVACDVCGLSPMGGHIPRSGTPVINIQATVQALINASFSVVVVEQSREATTRKRKKRYVAQVLTPSNPIYTHGTGIDDSRGGDFRDSPPIVGVGQTSRGLTLVEIYPELASYTLTSNMTIAATKSYIRRGGLLPSTVYVHSSVEENDLSQIKRDFLYDGTEAFLINHMFKRFNEGSAIDFQDFLLTTVKKDLGLGADFTFYRRSYPGNIDGTKGLRPVSYETASQIGLIPSRGIPDLVTELLPPTAKTASFSFLRNLLLTPPSHEVAAALRETVRRLIGGENLPDFLVLTPSRFIKPLSTNEVSGSLIHDLIILIHDFISLSESNALVASSILRLVTEQAGIAMTHAELLDGGGKMLDMILPVIYGHSENDTIPERDAPTLPQNPQINPKIFAAIEGEFRGRISSGASKKLEDLYEKVRGLANDYIDVLTRQSLALVDGKKSKLVFSDDNVALWIKGRPADLSTVVHPRDRNGREVGDHYSTPEVEEKLNLLKSAAGEARSEVTNILLDMARRLRPYAAEIHVLTLFSTAAKTLILHGREAIRKGWTFDVKVGSGESSPRNSVQIEGSFPYWLRRDESAPNDILFSGVATLHGGNMAGKSTICRQLASSTILASTGALAVPCLKMEMPEIDGVWLRMGSQDDPISGLSAFAVEARDVGYFLQNATERSLVIIDELGKGCPTKSGVAFAGAILKEMIDRRFLGLFSTHFFELWHIGLNLSQISEFHMEMTDAKPTHRMLPGKDLRSYALDMARSLGIENGIISFAEQLEKAYERVFLAGLGKDDNILGEEGCAPRSPHLAITGKLKVSPHTLEDAADIARNKIKEHKGDHVLLERHLEGRDLPTVIDTGLSCLYVIKTRDGFFYVGETDDICARIETHRRDNQKAQCGVVYFVVQGGKSVARHLESATIRELSRRGFPMLSTNDGRHVSLPQGVG